MKPCIKERNDLRQGVAELHHEIATNNIHIEELKTAYKQRGERMKEIKSAFEHHHQFTACSKQASYQRLMAVILAGFDPETGEPL